LEELKEESALAGREKKCKNIRQVALTTENWMITFLPGWIKQMFSYVVMIIVTY
jgi:hypothetical protein